MSDHVVCALADLPPGTARRVTVERREIAVFNVGGRLSAIADRCPHEGASLSRGQVGGVVVSDGPGDCRIEREGEMVRCPWHGWEFELATGRSFCDPARLRVRSFGVRVCPGAVLEKGPYRIETFPVRVDDAYVVVTL